MATKFPRAIIDADEYTESQNWLVYGDPGVGKGHPYGTEILTPKGWAKIEDLEVGDLVVGANGRPCNIIGVYDRGILDTYKVTFHDGSSVVTDGSHIWTVFDKNGKPGIAKTEEIMKYERMGYFSIPLVQPIEFPSETFLVRPYLLGVLLANGHLDSGTPAITTNDEEIIGHVLLENPDIEISESKRPEDAARVWRWKGGAAKLRDLELWETRSRTKFIPEDYFWGNMDQRKDLLAGLLDCDGSVRRSNGQAEYWTRSKDLADGVTRLVESLGGRASVHHYDDDYKLAITIGFNPFKLSRKFDLWSGEGVGEHRLTRRFESIEPVGRADVRCIAVDAADRLYVTEHYIVTHNTVLLGQLPNVLVVAMDPGVVSAARFSKPNGERKVWPIKNWNELVKVYEYLDTEDHPFEWVGFDSLTRAREVCLMDLTTDRYEKRSKLIEKQRKDTELEQNDPDIPELREYLGTQERLKKMVVQWNALPVNVMWTANTLQDIDEDANDIVYPLIPGKAKEGHQIAQYIMADMNVVAYYGIREEESRKLLLQPTPPFAAKNRYNTRDKKGKRVRFVEIARGDEQITRMDEVVAYVYNNGITEAA